jgi:aryl sulfotransferase
MKAHATKSVPLGGAFWDGGAQTFVHKGTNGRWRDTLTEADCRWYEETARRELGEACAHWLATGERAVEPGAWMGPGAPASPGALSRAAARGG